MWQSKILSTPKSKFSEKAILLTTKEDVLRLFQKPFPFIQDAVTIKNSDRKIVYHLYDRPINLNEGLSARKSWPFITFQLHFLPGKRDKVYIGVTDGTLLRNYQVKGIQVQKWFRRLFIWLASRDFQVLGLEVAEKGLQDLSFYTRPPMNFEITKRRYNRKQKLVAAMMQRVLPKL